MTSVVEIVEPHAIAQRAVPRDLRVRTHDGMRDDRPGRYLRTRADERGADDGRVLADANVRVNDDRSEYRALGAIEWPVAHQDRRRSPRRLRPVRLLPHAVLHRGEQAMALGQVQGRALDGDVATRRATPGELLPQCDERRGYEFEEQQTARDRDEAGRDAGEEGPGRRLIVSVDAAHPAGTVGVHVLLRAGDAGLEGDEMMRDLARGRELVQ